MLSGISIAVDRFYEQVKSFATGASVQITSVLPNIVTERLIIRLAEHKDRDAILAYYRDNRQHLQPFSPKWPSEFLTQQFWDHQVDINLAEFYADQSVRLFVFQKTQPHVVIANVSLTNIVRSAAQYCILGYGIAREKQNQGLMTEAVSAVIEYGFTALNLHRIMANYVPTNERSGKVLRRLGFSVEGYARDYLNLNGQWQDHILTALCNPGWQPE